MPALLRNVMLLDHLLNKPQGITTYTNYLAIIAFFIETIVIVAMKISNAHLRTGYRYLDFFFSKNIIAILTIRIALLTASFSIFLTDGYNYNRLSAIFYIYFIFFFVSLGWIYAYKKGYINQQNMDDDAQ